MFSVLNATSCGRGGRDHVRMKMATSLHDLAVLYYRQKRTEEARQYFQQSLSVWDKMPEPDERKLLLNLDNLAALECEQGNYAAAKPLCSRAIELRQKLGGAENPSLLDSLVQYADVLRKLNEAAAADKVEARARALKLQANVVDPH